MYETLVYQTVEGVITRIAIVNYSSEVFGSLFVNPEFKNKDWRSRKIEIVANDAYYSPCWMYLDLVAALSRQYGNAVPWGTADVLHRVVPHVSKAYIENYTHLMLLDYRTEIDRVHHLDLVANKQIKTVYERDITCRNIHLSKIITIQPITDYENEHVYEIAQQTLEKNMYPVKVVLQ
jgi:hypothetical protein